MNLANVANITIPEGQVRRIIRDGKSLWAWGKTDETDLYPLVNKNYWISTAGAKSGTDENWISSEKISVTDRAVVNYNLYSHSSVGNVVAYDATGKVLGYSQNPGNIARTYKVPTGTTHITLTGCTEKYSSGFNNQYVTLTDLAYGFHVGYQEVEYIESSGTQYINTGLYAPDGFTTQIGITFLSTENESCLIGMWQGDQRRYFGKIGQWYIGSPGLLSAPSINANEYLDIEVSTTNDEYLKINGESKSLKVVSADKEYEDAKLPVFLLSVNVAKTPRSPVIGKLYYCKIWDINNILVRDFVPCVRKSDGKPGMYDLVTDQFFTNAGTGEFIYE